MQCPCGRWNARWLACNQCDALIAIRSSASIGLQQFTKCTVFLRSKTRNTKILQIYAHQFAKRSTNNKKKPLPTSIRERPSLNTIGTGSIANDAASSKQISAMQLAGSLLPGCFHRKAVDSYPAMFRQFDVHCYSIKQNTFRIQDNGNCPTKIYLIFVCESSTETFRSSANNRPTRLHGIISTCPPHIQALNDNSIVSPSPVVGSRVPSKPPIRVNHSRDTANVRPPVVGLLPTDNEHIQFNLS